MTGLLRDVASWAAVLAAMLVMEALLELGGDAVFARERKRILRGGV